MCKMMDVPSVEGVVTLAYPLRALPSPPANDVFTLGDGPCGGFAKQVLTLVLETPRCACGSWRSSQTVDHQITPIVLHGGV